MEVHSNLSVFKSESGTFASVFSHDGNKRFCGGDEDEGEAGRHYEKRKGKSN